MSKLKETMAGGGAQAGMNVGVGMDLGTTNSSVACFVRDGVHVIANFHGHRTTP